MSSFRTRNVGNAVLGVPAAEDGSLVLCFDEYEVAPGSMGTVSFKVPPKVYRGDLKPEYK